jgi:hypothetical protein
MYKKRISFRVFGKHFLRKVCQFLQVVCFGFGFTIETGIPSVFAVEPEPSFHLEVSLATKGVSQEIVQWTVSDLAQLKGVKKLSSREKDPLIGKVFKWEGLSLSSLVDRALETLPLESRAQVDLIILKNAAGDRAQIPRSLIAKYPFLLVFHRFPLEIKETRGPLYSVAPWSSKPRILSEGLPLQKFFVPQLSKIELTSYRDQYSLLFLKRRTDPSAMRGEKLFIQNCTHCHNDSNGVRFSNERSMTRFESDGHPSHSIDLKLTERDRKSILRYFHAHELENQTDSKIGQMSTK